MLSRKELTCLMEQASSMNHKKIFKPYRGIHKDKPGIIFCTGPSLNDYKPIECHNEAIKFSMKSIVFKPEIAEQLDYYFCGDVNVRTIPHFEKIKELQCKKFTTLLINGEYSASDYEEVLAGVKAAPKKTRFWFTNDLAKELGCTGFAINRKSTFDMNIENYPLFKVATVFPTLQFAIHTGCSPIYLVGSDCSNDWSYREDGERSRFKTFPDKMIPQWKQVRKSLKLMGVKIISINPVNLRGYFKDLYL